MSPRKVRPPYVPNGRPVGCWPRKLTEAQALEALRRVLVNGEPKARVARLFGVSAHCIGHLIAGRTWAHLPRPQSE